MNLYKANLQTPIGEMTAISTEKGICLLDFSDKENLPQLISKVEKNSGGKIINEENEILCQLKTEISEYFDKKRTHFSVPTEVFGTEFQKKVWQSLTEISFGEKQSYKQQSEFLQSPKAIRAVASANGKNPVSIVVPCHRVVGSNGNLTGYAGGLWRKEFLLNLEKSHQII